MSCTAKTGPLKGPFTASIGNWLGERGAGTQWPPSPDTEKMEMSYWGAALVLIIAMSGRGDERREGRGWVPPCKVLEGVVLSPSALFLALPPQCRSVPSPRITRVTATPLKLDGTKHFFPHILGWQEWRLTLILYGRSLATSKITWAYSQSGETLPMQPGKIGSSLSPPSHSLLFKLLLATAFTDFLRVGSEEPWCGRRWGGVMSEWKTKVAFLLSW